MEGEEGDLCCKSKEKKDSKKSLIFDTKRKLKKSPVIRGSSFC
jgi:hypothetical protein